MQGMLVMPLDKTSGNLKSEKKSLKGPKKIIIFFLFFFYFFLFFLIFSYFFLIFCYFFLFFLFFLILSYLILCWGMIMLKFEFDLKCRGFNAGEVGLEVQIVLADGKWKIAANDYECGIFDVEMSCKKLQFWPWNPTKVTFIINMKYMFLCVFMLFLLFSKVP